MMRIFAHVSYKYALVALFTLAASAIFFVSHTQGLSRSDNIRIVSADGAPYGSQSVIVLNTHEEPAIIVSRYDGKDKPQQLAIEVYSIDRNDLLSFLIYKDVKHEYEYVAQESVAFDVSNRTPIATIPMNYKVGEDKKVTLPIHGSGIWLVRATFGGAVYNDAVMVRSNIAALAREGVDDQFIIWGQSLTTGKSLIDGSVTFYNLKDGVEAIGSTALNTNGVARMPETTRADLALIDSGGETAVIPLNLPVSYRYEKFGPRVIPNVYYLFTDRPLYKPGDTIYFKAIVREDDDARYGIPSGSARVRVFKNYDAEHPVYERILAFSANGSVSGAYTLPADVSTGFYQIEIATTGDIERTEWMRGLTTFQVEHYRKPEYGIDVTSETSEVVRGEVAAFTIAGKYFFGAPIADKDIEYTVSSAQFYESDYYYEPSEMSEDDRYQYGYWGGDTVKSGSATLGADGVAQVEIPTDNLHFVDGRDHVLVMEARFRDESGTPVVAKKNILVRDSDYRLYRTSYSYSGRVGEEFALPLKVLDATGKPVVGVEITVEPKRQWWEKKGGLANWGSSQYTQRTQDLARTTIVTDVRGEAAYRLTPSASGSYTIVLSYRDDRGNVSKRTFSAWIVSPNEPIYGEGGAHGLSVVSDKAKYRPGETAWVTVTSRIPDRDVFLSIERDGVHRFWVTHLDGLSARVPVNIVETDIPNMTVAASGFSDDFDYATYDMPVSVDSKKITVHTIVRGGQESYAPGEQIVVDVQTVDAAGDPVSADVALWSVDKALYELARDTRSSIFNTFWHTRYNATMFAQSFEGVSRGGGAEKGGGGGDEGGSRTIFEDTAYWNPSIRTDAAGRATVTFTLPDNLTTWVIQSVAATADTEVGESRAEIVVTKPVIVRPILPNLLRVGDIAHIVALAHNYTGATAPFAMNFAFAGVAAGAEQSFELSRGATKQVFWDITPQEEDAATSARFSLTQRDGTQRDMIEIPLPIKAFGVVERSAQTGTGSTEFALELHDDTSASSSRMTLSLASSFLGTLPVAMEYLVAFPYGCIEQTTSRFVPAVLAKEHADIFGSFIKRNADLDGMIRTGAARLSELAQSGGGWTWWRWGEVNPFVTAYATEYLVRAQRLGYDIDARTLDATRLKFEQELETEHNASVRIAQVYTLSLLGSPKGKIMLTDFSGVTPDILALAVIVNRRNHYTDPSRNGVDALKRMARERGDTLYWDAGNTDFFPSIEASTALALRALTVAGENATAEKAARYLYENRPREYWHNSFATAQTIEALTDFSKIYSGSAPNLAYEVRLGDTTIAHGTMTSLTQEVSIPIPLRTLESGAGHMTIIASGEGSLYSTIVTEEFRTNRNPKPVSRPLTVKRSYSGDFTVGSVVEVRLRVDGVPKGSKHLMVEDTLPAGLVPINPIFKNEFYDSDAERYSNYYNGADYPAAQEVTPEGMATSFESGLDDGVEFTYKARVVTRGIFHAPPATAFLMYDADVYGRSSADTVTIDDNAFTPAVGMVVGVPAVVWWILALVVCIGVVASAVYVWRTGRWPLPRRTS